jgi:radical SAM protein with 4Fe4S-binding SPASM domain
VDKFPDVIRMESAGYCNFRCTHCPVGIHGNTRSLMSFEVFETIFNRLPLIPRVLVLYHGGEPLLNKELEKMIHYAKAHGVQKVLLNSNVSLLTIERAEQLSLAGLDEMRVSFDGSTPEENNKIRVGSNFAKHAAIVKESARFLNIVIYNVKFDGDRKPAKYLTDYFGTAVKYRTDLARVWAHEETSAAINNAPTYCSETFEKMSILSNGDVVTCCEDLMGDEIHGNVLQNSPAELWEQMQAFRDNFRQRNYSELCKHCYVITGSRLAAA